MNASSRARRTLAAALILVAYSTTSAAQTIDDLRRRTAEVSALVEAEGRKTPLCKSYMGKVIAPIAPSTLAARLTGAGGKGEFETTAQYKQRQVGAASGSAGPFVVGLPIDRGYTRFDADAGVLTVSAGAFATGEFSDEGQADLAAMALTLPTDGSRGLPGGLPVHLSQSERTLGTSMARNGFGIAVRVSNVERHTRALYLFPKHLFGVARDKDSVVMGFEATAARAKQLKPSLRVALVLEPQPPSVLSGIMEGAAATSRDPLHYQEKTTLIVASAKCGLVLDGSGRVLASADAN